MSVLANIHSITFLGIEAHKVDIQVHIGSFGLPSFTIVGLPDKSIVESKERVRAAFSSIGLGIPNKKITVNLSPASLFKEGSHFDLGIAIALLIAMKIIPKESLENYIVMGELALNGNITSISHVLPAAIKAHSWELGIICPNKNVQEAILSGNSKIVAAETLLELINHLLGKHLLTIPVLDEKINNLEDNNNLNFADVRGQTFAKRALEIAAIGKHNVLMVGPPGSGKSMLAKRFPYIMPELTREEKLEISIIASIGGELKNGLIQERPFRSPHSSSSMAAIVGGGRNAQAGEITKAHLGILFLDELPQFNKTVLEALRQPIEDKKIALARANCHIVYPSNFQLIAAMNPCKCGYYNTNSNLTCSKAPKCVEDYQSKISGPLLDRFDIQVYVPQTNNILKIDIETETTEEIKKRVISAIKFKEQRKKDITLNDLKDNDKKFLQDVMTKYHLSMRSVDKVLKVARTIADISLKNDVTKMEIAEAVNYRIIKDS